MEMEKPSVNILKHSRILDSLVTHSDSQVRIAAADFIAAFQPPADAPYIKLVLSRLQLGLTLLNTDLALEQAFGYSISSVSTLVKAVQAMEDDEPRAEEIPTSKWLKKFAAYGAIVELAEDDTHSLKALATAFALSQLNQKSIDKKFADQIRLQTRSPASEVIRKERAWEVRHQSNLKSIKSLSGCTRFSSDVEFQEAALSHYIADTKYATFAERRGLSDDRALTPNAFTDAAAELKLGLFEFNAVSTAIAVGFFSGLTWPLAKRTPLTAPVGDNWVIWLDIPNGCYHVNLNPVVRGAAENGGNEKYVPATRIFRRYLPQLLVKSLQFLSMKRPHLLSLEALCDCIDIPSEFDICRADDRRIKSSIARLYNTRTVISNMLCISSVSANLTLGLLQRIPHSKLFYNATNPQKFNEAIVKLAALLDWGDIQVQDEDGPSIGSSVNPELDALKNIAAQLASAVRDSVPPKNYRWRHLRKFHNAFADYVIFLLSLSAMGRDSEALLIQSISTISATGMTGLHDKITRNSLGASPVVLSSIVKAQVKAYMLHMQCLLARLATLGHSDTPAHARISDILNDAEVDAFFHMPDEPEKTLIVRGAASLYRDLEGWLEIKPDAGRHFWESMLTQSDAPDDYIDAQARHTVRHSRYWSANSTLAIDQMQEVLAPIQDRILRQMGIDLIWGLRK